jgi:hypothetical protein
MPRPLDVRDRQLCALEEQIARWPSEMRHRVVRVLAVLAQAARSTSKGQDDDERADAVQ